MNVIAIAIIIISGFFLNISLLLEKLYRDNKENMYEDNYYFEWYTFFRVLAFFELIVGIIIYLKNPLPLILPMESTPMIMVYHAMIWLMCIICGAWVFEKYYQKIK